MIKKLPYYKQWDVTPCEIYLISMNEEGEEIIEAEWRGKVNLSETNKRVQDRNGMWVHLSGLINVKGDIFPAITNISQGYAVINGEKINILIGRKRRNPDGSINHTELELL